MKIKGRKIDKGESTYIIAEMSANHGGKIDNAIAVIKEAKNAGADAIKLQTYTPDTLTIDCANKYFRIKGTIWQGKTLYDLYAEAYTPWEWHAELQTVAADLGLDFFSTPFDPTAVDFLESLNVPVYKIASFEIVDLPLLKKVSATKKPVIMSTGMATLAEIDEAVTTLRQGGAPPIALLKCTSAYPASPAAMNLRTIPHLAAAFGVVAGLSDHSLSTAAPVAAVTLGASIIEKHLTLSRRDGGPDSGFSLEPGEFKAMVTAVREAEQALGAVSYAATESEEASRAFRRSLFIVRDVQAGEVFSRDNLRSIRPGHGLLPRHFETVLGRRAAQDIKKGTPLAWDLIGGNS